MPPAPWHIGTPPIEAEDHSATSLSPCSPAMYAWTLPTATLTSRAISWRSRDESSTVPEPNMRAGSAADILIAA